VYRCKKCKADFVNNKPVCDCGENDWTWYDHTHTGAERVEELNEEFDEEFNNNDEDEDGAHRQFEEDKFEFEGSR